MYNMSGRAVHFLVMVILRVNMVRSAIGYHDYRFPCGPEDCSESITCWNDTSKRPLLNCPTSELSATFVGQLECDKGDTVLQKRSFQQPSVAFNRTWHDYETGFGSNGNFWIGLKGIHRLSSRGRNLLTIGMININGSRAVERYSGFWVDDASSQYTMHAGLSRRGGGGTLEPVNSRPFTAPDGGRTGCANEFESGWWFPSSCQRTLINLNGRHNSTGSDKIFVLNAIVVHSIMTMRQTFIHCDRTCPNGGTCRKSSTGDSYVCDCHPRYIGRRCEVSMEETTVTTTPTATVKATNGSNRNVTSPTTSSPLDVFALLAFVVLPVFVAIAFVVAISALIVRKCVEMEKNTGEETPLVRKTKRHKKRRRTTNVKRGLVHPR